MTAQTSQGLRDHLPAAPETGVRGGQVQKLTADAIARPVPRLAGCRQDTAVYPGRSPAALAGDGLRGGAGHHLCEPLRDREAAGPRHEEGRCLDRRRSRRVPAHRDEPPGPEPGRAIAAQRTGRTVAAVAPVAAEGMRRGEALGLRWADITWERGTAHIVQTVARTRRNREPAPTLIQDRAKTRASARTVRLTAETLAVLRTTGRRSWNGGCARRNLAGSRFDRLHGQRHPGQPGERDPQFRGDGEGGRAAAYPRP